MVPDMSRIGDFFQPALVTAILSYIISMSIVKQFAAQGRYEVDANQVRIFCLSEIC